MPLACTTTSVWNWTASLKSWAVPKGPSLNPADKRLAVQVEDHPLDYRTFEGTIPAGNYGAGRGHRLGRRDLPHGRFHRCRQRDGDELRRGLESGRLSIVLDGHKLKGEFTLVRTVAGARARKMARTGS